MPELKQFPSSRSEALALEYAKLRFTPEMTPEEFCKIFFDALLRIKSETSKLYRP